jgi:general nucleoside transport system ATP-binding protein
MDAIPMVEMIGITKKFPGVIANDEVSFTVNSGEVHALLGENGAGKSTLMSVLTGLYRPDAGEIRIKGKKVELLSPRDAVRNGVGMVHQHFKLVQPLTAAENIMLGLKGLKQIYDFKPIEAEILACSKKYGLTIEPHTKIWQLSVGEQQRVEIVKMLFRGAEILILDEPTAVLTPQEAAELYKTLRSMAEHGKAVIVISHKMNEVLENTDYITVLRDGRNVGTVRTGSTSETKLARMMVGRDIIRKIDKDKSPDGAQVLTIQNVSAIGDRGRLTLKDVSFDIKEGEILGIAGVAGNGQKDLAEVIAGLRAVNHGKLYIKKLDCTGTHCRKLIDAGVSYIPEDRMTTGLVPNLNAFENMVLKSYRRMKGWFINWAKIHSYTQELIDRFDIKISSPNYPVKMMSGGNLQKLLLAREIDSNPDLIVAVYPMRGLDIGATESIRKLLLAQRSSGKAILLISEELDELFELSDRIAVLHAGEIMGIVDPSETTIEAIGMMMAGKRMMECNA